MSASGQPTGDRCGKWMPRAKDYSADARPRVRVPYNGSPGRPQGAADGASAWTDTRHPGDQVPLEPDVQAQAHGPDPERFSQMLEAQGNACEMCRTAFEEDHLICIDHDHACCPPALPSRCCGQCVRGPAVPQLQYRPRVHRGVLRTGDGQPQTALRRPVPPTGRA